jgi:hypothetical protein
MHQLLDLGKGDHFSFDESRNLVHDLPQNIEWAK